MKTFQTWLVCIVFIVAGCFVGSLFSSPTTANANNAPPLFNTNLLELPLSIDIHPNGRVNVQNALNRTVSVQNSMPRVVYRWRTHIKYRYHIVYRNNSVMANRQSIRQYDSIAKGNTRSISRDSKSTYLISKPDSTTQNKSITWQ